MNVELSGPSPKRVITSFGIGWHKSAVKWKHRPELLGTRGSRIADVGPQEGIYVLYNSAGYLYVGISRAGIGGRLQQHVRKPWDRFSWFGFRDIDLLPSPSGICQLGPPVWKAAARQIRLKDVIRDFEAVLTRLPVKGENRAKSTLKHAEEWKQLKPRKARNSA